LTTALTWGGSGGGGGGRHTSSQRLLCLSPSKLDPGEESMAHHLLKLFNA